VLATERLVLRELCADDVAAFQSHWADERFQERYPPGRMTPELCRDMVEREAAALSAFPRTNYHWAIEHEETVIGGVRPATGSGRTIGAKALRARRWLRSCAMRSTNFD
jgi:hypothetical protein